MSKYTIELGELVKARYQLALFDYPIFDENYREVLNAKIIDHFYFREIGQETPDRFNMMLGRKMREIMPFYNQRYQSTMLQFDPLAADYFEQQQQGTSNRKNKAADMQSIDRDEKQDRVIESKRQGNAQMDLTGSHDQTVNGQYQKEGARGVETEDKTVGEKTGENQENSTRTDNLTEARNDTTNTETTRTDNLTEETDKTIDRTGEEDSTGKDTTVDTIQTGQTVTNNLTKTQDGQTDTTGNRSETGAKSNVFADTPQNNLSVSLTMNQNGTSTTNASGYATTLTQDNDKKTANDEQHSTTSSTTKDTGTVDTEGNSTENKTVDTTNKKEYTEKVTEDGTRKNTGTVETVGNETLNATTSNTGTVKTVTDGNFTENSTVTANGTTTEKWTENGTNQEKLDYTEQQQRKEQTDQTENTQDNYRRHSGDLVSRISTQDNQDQSQQKLWYKGRRGMSPAQLLQAYRDTFINVDMEVIAELEPLFMLLW